MKELKMTFYTEREVVLPLAYNHLLQGLLYGCWRESYPNLHDAGEQVPFNLIKLFVFGPLVGGHANGKRKELVIDGAVRFEVRSPHDELIDELAVQLGKRESVRLGKNELRLVNLQLSQRLLFPEHALIRTASPVTAHRTLDDGHTVYYAPDEDVFYALIYANIAGKLEEAGLDPHAQIDLEPVANTLRKRVTRFKGIYVTGWDGSFVLEAPSEAMALLYHCGIGARNSQGFGMFDIADTPV